MRRWLLVWSVALLCCAALLPNLAKASGKWELQYEHIDADDDLRLFDIAFIDANRGIASGLLTSRKNGRVRPVNLVTTNGRTWTVAQTKKACPDLFALPQGILFAACEDGIYRSDEMGKDWERQAKLKNISRIWFVSPSRGFAIGAEKSFYETSDGGKRWSAVKTNPELTTSKEYSSLHHIDFADEKNAIITGWSRIPRAGRELFPDWMTPDRAVRQRDTPHVNFLIDSRDGGATWTAQEVSMFGEIVSAKLSDDGIGLGLINFSNAFEFPSEVFVFRWPSGVTERVFREKNRAITDIALPRGGPAYLVGIEPGGALFWSPVAGRLKVLETTDFHEWTEMAVDYRASATRASFAVLDPANIWVFTDTGKILKLSRDSTSLPQRTAPPARTPAAQPPAAQRPEAAKPAP
jgi:hypothetical protein